jgi:MFS transporter, ACS family, pantothenate transporter
LIGASVSSTDIAKELGPFAKIIYQSSRGGLFDLPATLLPENAHRIRGIESFNLSTQPKCLESNEILDETQNIPQTVTLVDGTILDNIDRVLICTGYHCSFPFLKDYHQDSVRPEEVDETTLVTNGEQVHNLHKDIFYIPDPTLSFVGVPYHVATFTLFEFQAMAVAAVYSGKARLPEETAMRAEYEARVQKNGFGRGFNSLKGQDIQYADSLVNWINGDAKSDEGSRIEGHSKEWQAVYEDFLMKLKKRSKQNE